jgi:hypothetical protein
MYCHAAPHSPPGNGIPWLVQQVPFFAPSPLSPHPASYPITRPAAASPPGSPRSASALPSRHRLPPPTVVPRSRPLQGAHASLVWNATDGHAVVNSSTRSCTYLLQPHPPPQPLSGPPRAAHRHPPPPSRLHIPRTRCLPALLLAQPPPSNAPLHPAGSRAVLGDCPPLPPSLMSRIYSAQCAPLSINDWAQLVTTAECC